jgi:NADH-quinone oxidoreductase subunit N
MDFNFIISYFIFNFNFLLEIFLVFSTNLFYITNHFIPYLDTIGFYNVFYLDIFIGNFFYYLDLLFFCFLLFFILYVAVTFNTEYRQNLNMNLVYSLDVIIIFLFLLFISYFFLNNIFHYPAYSLFNQLIIVSKFTLFIKMVLCFFSLCFIYFIKDSLKYHGFMNYEFSFFYLFSLLGIFFSISSNDFLSLFCGLEIMNLSLYVLAAFIKKLISNLEAGTKYLILGSISTGIFLKGISLLYLSFGTTNFLNLDIMEFAYLTKSYPEIILPLGVGILLVTVSFLFKLGVAPFHSWAVDVYGGTSMPITAYFSTIVKSTVFLIFTMLSFRLSWPLLHGWESLLLILGFFSAFIGAFGAFRQQDIKKFFAYSSINHAGFLIIFLAFFNQDSLTFALIYLFTYVFTMLTIFIIFLNITGYTFKVESFDGIVKEKSKIFFIIKYFSDLQNFGKLNKRIAFAISLLFFSLGGIPPFIGFFPKLTLLKVLLDSKHFLLLLVVICLSVLSLAYYLRVIKIMYFDKSTLNNLNVINSNKDNFVYENIKVINRFDYNLLFFAESVLFLFMLAPFYFTYLYDFFYRISWSIFYPFS